MTKGIERLNLWSSKKPRNREWSIHYDKISAAIAIKLYEEIYSIAKMISPSMLTLSAFDLLDTEVENLINELEDKVSADTVTETDR